MRRILRELPLGQKLVFAMMATSSVALTVACSFFLGYDIIGFRSDVTRHLESVGEIIAANSAAALTYNDPRSATLVLDALRSEPHILAARIYRANGETFSSYRRDASVTIALSERSFASGTVIEPNRLTECHAITLDQEGVGRVCLQSDLQEMRARGRRYIAFVLVFFCSSIIAAFMVALLLKRFISQPILDLIGTAKTVSKEKNYAIRAVRHAPDELGLLVEGFNEMLSEIEQRDGELKSQVQTRTRMNFELTKAKESAEAANRAKSQFLANMSHEIRSPLNGVIGMTELALTTELSIEQRKYLRTVQSSAKSLMFVINEILDFSKIDAEQLQLHRAEFNLEELVAEIHQSFATLADQKSIELMYEIEPDVPAVLYSDAQRLRQVLVNLIANAIKFTEMGEVITRIGLESGSEKTRVLHCWVEDTGIGIPPEKQKMIFDPFAQVDSSHSRKYGGTGLGLTISRRIVELMGGKLWVESQPNCGSVFHFRLPIEARACAQPRESDLRIKKLQGLRVLIVDDNHANGLILRKIMQSWNMLPEVAADAETALRLLREDAGLVPAFDVLLIDAEMPGTDGFALVQSIDKPQLPHLCTIMMLSSNALQESLARCDHLQLSKYIQKPIGRRALLENILGVWEKPGVSSRVASPLRKASRSLHVLLAEDNPVNQEMAFKLLLMQGHNVEAVPNGRQALAAVQSAAMQSKTFDVILMDIQMPEMDGLEATAAIRALEEKTGGHLPVIALTAHAMRADRERCIAAGMDGYLQKPFYPDDLHNALSPYCTRLNELNSAKDSSLNEEPPARTENPSENEVYNATEALARAGGSKKLLQRVSRVFLDNLPRMRENIQVSIAKQDSAALQNAAHTLKGSASLIGARATTMEARQLETIARSGKLEGANIALNRLDKELKLLTEVVTALQQQEP